jgi:hypothetical protein
MLRKIAVFCFTASLTAAAPQTSTYTTSSSFDSVFVPLDSWVYPALYRLAGMGYIPDQFSNMAPWTRDECARQIKEAEGIIKQRVGVNHLSPDDNEALKMIADLRAEINDKLEDDSDAIRLESIYTAFTGIVGTPLADSYHFGQTIVNNYGRPYYKGFNNDTGASAYANYNRFFIYLRGELQHSAGAPVYSLATRQYIANEDANPLYPAASGSSFTRFEPEEMYVGVQVGPENISFGRENLWWGPGQDSAFAFSDNAGPFVMLNFDQTKPIVLPWIFKYLGEMRTQFIFGELSGHLRPRYPQVNAQKVTFDITKDLEVGITRSAFWGGQGHPVTLGDFEKSLFSTGSTGCGFGYGDRCDPGDRHTGFDARWRLPGLRKYVTVYTDSYADDEVNPLANPKRSAWGPGIYISQLPKLTKFDFRFESYDTWLNVARDGQFFYWNDQYHDSYTNDGLLLGSYVGRQARAFVGTIDYWVSGRTKFQAQVRHLSEPNTYLPGGGSQTDGALSVQWSVSPELLVSLTGQAEAYDIPIIGPSHKDGTVAFSLTYTPKSWTIQ